MKIAEVIVDITNSQVDRVFDYIATEQTKIGTRVLVPFGNREIQGFVINLKENSNVEISKLKSIISPIDDFVCISEEMISLMHFMVKKYHLRYIDCLRLFVPSEMRTDKVRPITKIICILNNNINLTEVKDKTRKNATKRLAFLDFVKQDTAYFKTDLNDKFSSQTINKLIEDNVLIQSEIGEYRRPSFNVIECDKRIHTPMQTRAIESILSDNKTFLLFGVTGSGKTEVYMSVIEQIISKGKTAIMLVPEISLTPQVLGNFKARFGDEVAILHSGLGIGERFDEWRRLITGEAKIVVGARSAIFAPLKNVGVIIIDEEHETSYISESNPRYSAFDIAHFRSEYNKCPLVLASATPSIESYNKAQSGEYKLLELPVRINGRPMPKIQIVDMLMELRNGNSSMFSSALVRDLEECISGNHQAMIFINRRGYSSFMRCQECGYIAKCSDCDVSLVYHKEENTLKCHFCGKRYKALTKCPNCGSESIRQGAVGTEQVASKLKTMFNGVKILRMDNDTTRNKNGHQKILSEFANSKPAILVGTQMIAKGHDFSDVTVVGIIDADQSLFHSSYSSTEKTFELITQMSGRAGREKLDGKVVLQTYAPKHYAYRFIANYDYKGFFERELKLRKMTNFPPYTTIVRLLFSAENEEIVRKTTKMCYDEIVELKNSDDNFVYLDAMKSPIGKIKNKIRYQILMRLKREKSDDIIAKLYEICDKYNNGKVSLFVEINPQNLS